MTEVGQRTGSKQKIGLREHDRIETEFERLNIRHVKVKEVNKEQNFKHAFRSK